MEPSSRPATTRKTLLSFYAPPRLTLQESFTPQEVARFLNIGIHAVEELSKRDEDPLPLRMVAGRTKGKFAMRDELMEWAYRNCPLVADEKPQ